MGVAVSAEVSGRRSAAGTLSHHFGQGHRCSSLHRPRPSRISRSMKNALSPEALSQLYVDARTFSYWLPEPVSDELLHQVYELTKLGATSANSHSTRFFFVKSPEVKKRRTSRRGSRAFPSPSWRGCPRGNHR